MAQDVTDKTAAWSLSANLDWPMTRAGFIDQAAIAIMAAGVMVDVVDATCVRNVSAESVYKMAVSLADERDRQQAANTDADSSRALEVGERVTHTVNSDHDRGSGSVRAVRGPYVQVKWDDYDKGGDHKEVWYSIMNLRPETPHATTRLADERDRRMKETLPSIHDPGVWPFPKESADVPWVPKVGDRVVTLSGRAGVVSFSNFVASNGVPSTIVHMDHGDTRTMFADDSLRPETPERIPPEPARPKPIVVKPSPDAKEPKIIAWVDMPSPGEPMSVNWPTLPYADKTQHDVVTAGIEMLQAAGIQPVVTTRRWWYEKRLKWYQNDVAMAVKAHDYLIRDGVWQFHDADGWRTMLKALEAGSGRRYAFVDCESSLKKWYAGAEGIGMRTLSVAIKAAVENVHPGFRVYLYGPLVSKTGGRSSEKNAELCRTILDAGAPVVQLIAPQIGRPIRALESKQWKWMRDQLAIHDQQLWVHTLVEADGFPASPRMWTAEDVLGGALVGVYEAQLGRVPDVIEMYPGLEHWLNFSREVQQRAKK